jgi:amidohydrolase
MTQLLTAIRELARVYHSETIAIRRHLHAHPELSGEEESTAAFVVHTLGKLGVTCRSGVGGHGIVADIAGRDADAGCVALRADMDALPLTEENEVPYRSRVDGVMHACGHDAHTAILLGVARILTELKGSFRGTVRLLFQPSEERYPGGALPMIADGALENPVPDFLFGAHVSPELPAGTIGIRPGPFMASTDEVYLTVHGKGGHAATPHLNTDPVVTAANIITALQQLTSRLAPPDIPTLLSFGRVIADGQMNVIPDVVTLDGTFRTYQETWRGAAHTHIRRIASKTAESAGGTCDVRIERGYPVLVNESRATALAMQLAQQYLGEEMVVEVPRRMTGDDFAHFAAAIPACFCRIGTGNEKKGITANLHTPRFDIDEKSLETAAGTLTWIATGVLQNL